MTRAPDDEVSLADRDFDVLSATIKETVRLTNFSRDAIYSLVRDGEIQSFLLFGRRYIIVQSVREYLARRAAEPMSIRHGPNSRPPQDGPGREVIPT